MIRLGTGSRREAWLREDGLVALRARPGAIITAAEWAAHAVRLRWCMDLGLRVPRVHEVRPDGLLVDRVPGPSMREVQRAGRLSPVQGRALQALVHAMVAHATYVGDLNPRNLVWHQGAWWIIDCGALRQPRSAEYIRRKMAKKWKRS